jgi:hypothetical protein
MQLVKEPKEKKESLSQFTSRLTGGASHLVFQTMLFFCRCTPCPPPHSPSPSHSFSSHQTEEENLSKCFGSTRWEGSAVRGWISITWSTDSLIVRFEMVLCQISFHNLETGYLTQSLLSVSHSLSLSLSQISHLFRAAHRASLGLKGDGKPKAGEAGAEDIAKQTRMASRLIIRAVDK